RYISPLNPPGGEGVFGGSADGKGVHGETARGIGVHGKALDPTGKAALFEGQVVITGTLILNGKQVQAMVEPAIVTMSAPTGAGRWLEHFGTTRLVDGSAKAHFDTALAAVVGDDYRVFLTPRGDCNGLYVDQA